ncbi:MAG: phosphatidate cytidylyltransferase [Treponema sp.]|jgi:phosphatidate cytidylyltransferase|nr:phosphatidate cytidylyltransferase [Treponema sp.]
MKKILPRLLIFFVGCPVIFFLVWGLPYRNHLALNILVILVSILGALEFQHILKKKRLVISIPETLVLGGLGPIAMTLEVSFAQNENALLAMIALGASWLLVSRAFYPLSKLADCASRVAAGFAVMIYPGLFLAWIIRMSFKPESESPLSSVVILAFLFIVFAGDSIAWAAGMLFGKGNRGIIPASPNKSIAGFASGLTASTLVGTAAGLLFPEAFESSAAPSAAGTTVLGFATGLAAILGDLGESVFKRSSGIKDSGTIMPGRGGVLDSVDSIALAAPVFYVVYMWFFRGH